MPQTPYVPRPTTQSYNITAATVIKASPGTLWRINVVVAGSAAGTANDCATTGAVGAANEICAIPNTAGLTIEQQWPCKAGICITPGSGQTLAVSFS